MSKATNTATIFGTNASVCSWICVVACKMLTVNPTRRADSSNGAAAFSTVNMACPAMLMMVSAPTFVPLFLRDRRQKLSNSDLTTKCQPSTRINSNILNGKDIMTGGNIIMPMDINTLATTISMTRNGMKIMKPI